MVKDVRTYQGIEDRQNVPAVFHHAREDISKLRLALGFFVPFSENQRGYFDVPTKLFRGMAAQKETIEEGRFTLREIEVVNDFRGNDLWQGRHGENAVYRK